jgi:hypothetical protein
MKVVTDSTFTTGFGTTTFFQKISTARRTGELDAQDPLQVVEQ